MRPREKGSTSFYCRRRLFAQSGIRGSEPTSGRVALYGQTPPDTYGVCIIARTGKTSGFFMGFALHIMTVRSSTTFCRVSITMAFDAARSENLRSAGRALRLAADASARRCSPKSFPARAAPCQISAVRWHGAPRSIDRGRRLDRRCTRSSSSLNLPAWSLRRLFYEDGEWFCSLSRQLNLPLALDDTADAHHDSLPLAILLAFLQARRMAETAPAVISVTPHVQPAPDSMICCDNFA